MPGISLRHFKMFWSVRFMMQDCCFFPESPFRSNRQNSCILLRKYFWVIGCCIRLNLSNFCWSPRCQRTNFQPNDLQSRCIHKQVRVGEDNGLLVLFIYVDVRLTAKLLRKLCLNSRAKLLRKENFCPCIGFLVKGILLGVRTLFPRLILAIAQYSPVQDQINILRKTAD